tara:strand:+ start:4566 stop:4697 length:132 start_codon:yes stop_codon:yes gene_type:complete
MLFFSGCCKVPSEKSLQKKIKQLKKLEQEIEDVKEALANIKSL